MQIVATVLPALVEKLQVDVAISNFKDCTSSLTTVSYVEDGTRR